MQISFKKKLKDKADEVVKSILGYELSSEQSCKIKVCRNHFGFIEDCIKTLDESIKALSIQYREQTKLLATIPGITENSALYVIAEIGIDMRVFHSSKHLCSWSGVTPQNNESAGKKKSVHISRAGVYLKPLLVQCANAALKDKTNPYFKNKYDKIKKRRGHKRAIIAIARMMLTCIYQILLNNESFNPSDINYSDIPEVILKKNKKQYIDSAILLLQKQGFTVSKDELIGATA